MDDEWKFITVYIYKNSEGDYFASSNQHIIVPGGGIVGSREVAFMDNNNNKDHQ